MANDELDDTRYDDDNHNHDFDNRCTLPNVTQPGPGDDDVGFDGPTCINQHSILNRILDGMNISRRIRNAFEAACVKLVGASESEIMGGRCPLWMIRALEMNNYFENLMGNG